MIGLDDTDSGHTMRLMNIRVKLEPFFPDMSHKEMWLKLLNLKELQLQVLETRLKVKTAEMQNIFRGLK